MNHTTKSTTHWACNEQMAKHGKDTSCCACTKHECPPEPEDKLIKKRLHIKK